MTETTRDPSRESTNENQAIKYKYSQFHRVYDNAFHSIGRGKQNKDKRVKKMIPKPRRSRKPDLTTHHQHGLGRQERVS